MSKSPGRGKRHSCVFGNASTRPTILSAGMQLQNVSSEIKVMHHCDEINTDYEYCIKEMPFVDWQIFDSKFAR